MIALPILLVLPPLLLVAMVLVPNRIANSSVSAFRQFVTGLAAAHFAVAMVFATALVSGAMETVHWTMFDFTSNGTIAVTVMYDGVACLMYALVAFVGWVICRYSVRYLDGEVTQGRYFRWTAFAIGSVSLMVISGNLLMFMLAWVMTSTALHKLLLHYGHRSAAQRAAWTKFTISRLGDAALLAAIALVYAEFRTFDLATIFAAIESASTPVTLATHVAGFLLVIGAVTKSAQFPFHTWLPLTMETPTPVSALMHAGIVNAGGYLIIRTSPLVSATPWALTLLAVVGGFTACFAAVVMVTQTSIKKKLAYSTIAQMGFMLLQCGLGAYSAAMLHILAHSLYKAHAFLSSGSVMSQRAATKGAADASTKVSWLAGAGIAVLMAGLLVVFFLGFGIDVIAKPGGVLLAGVLCLALSNWVTQTARTGSGRLLVQSLAVSTLLCFVYVASYVAVDSVVAASVPKAITPALYWPVVAAVLAGFVVMYALHFTLSVGARPQWMHRWYIHAHNGFYMENTLRRISWAFNPR